MTRPEALKPVIFLIGNVRSGTSMTRRLFELHPDLSTLREPRTVWMYPDPGRPHDRFTADDASPRVVRFIRGRFLRFQGEHGGRRLMEKTPSNMLRIPFMHAVFPESRFLYIVRHPFAQLASSEKKWRQDDVVTHRRMIQRLRETPKTQLHYYVGRFFGDAFRRYVLRRKYRATWGVRYPGMDRDVETLGMMEVLAKQWAESCRIAEEDLALLPPGVVYRTTYETLVADPVNEFARILAHFDLEMTPGMAESVSGMVDPGRQEKWRERLDPAELRRILPILKPQMDRLGYTAPEGLAAGPAADAAISDHARVPGVEGGARGS